MITDKIKKIDNPSLILYSYCKDTVDEWPRRWEISEEDLDIGKAITEHFKEFLLYRIKQGRSKRTIHLDASYLWALGGELIRAINEDDSERSLSAKDLILKYVDESGGPYWRHASGDWDHDRYDSVCRQLFKFMTTHPN